MIRCSTGIKGVIIFPCTPVYIGCCNDAPLALDGSAVMHHKTSFLKASGRVYCNCRTAQLLLMGVDQQQSQTWDNNFSVFCTPGPLCSALPSSFYSCQSASPFSQAQCKADFNIWFADVTQPVIQCYNLPSWLSA